MKSILEFDHPIVGVITNIKDVLDSYDIEYESVSFEKTFKNSSDYKVIVKMKYTDFVNRSHPFYRLVMFLEKEQLIIRGSKSAIDHLIYSLRKEINSFFRKFNIENKIIHRIQYLTEYKPAISYILYTMGDFTKDVVILEFFP